MLLRRVLGLLLVACLSHLAVAASDLACATHDGHDVAQSVPAEMPDGHHHDEGGQPEEQCKLPVSSTCCEAMTSCAAGAALVTIIDDQPAGFATARVIAVLADAPLTRILPPDPPPPKA